jgi:hypothetical protein
MSASFSCKFISNEDLTFHFEGPNISIIIVKQPSASVKPVTKLGSSPFGFKSQPPPSSGEGWI